MTDSVKGIDKTIAILHEAIIKTPGGKLELEELTGEVYETALNTRFWTQSTVSLEKKNALFNLALVSRAFMPEIVTYLRKVHAAFEVMGIDPAEIYQQAVDEADSIAPQ